MKIQARRALRLLYRLGLRFEDPVMEKTNQDSQIKIENNVFFAYSLLCSVATVGQVIVDYTFGKGFVVINTIIVVGAIIALLVKNKVNWFYKIFFMMYIPLNNFLTINNTINVTVPYSPGITYLIGNYLGMIEVLYVMAFRRTWLQVLLACLQFAVKIVAFGSHLPLDDSFAWICLVFIIVLIIAIYEDALERRNFRQIYESKQTLGKFQDLLSNDFPSNVLIVDSSFKNIRYSNQAFRQKFITKVDPDNSELISLVFMRFQIESLVKPAIYQNLIYQGSTLLDFVQKVPVYPSSMQSDEVIVLSATYGLGEENLQHFEIRLRKILWEGQSCYTVILNDLSDKQLVTALKYADEQKDRVIATVSHELRTPINGILGLLEMAEPQVTDETAQTYLQHCKSCSKLLLYLVNSILDLSQIRHNKLQIVKNKFSLDELLEEMKALYQFQCQQKGIALVIQRGLLVPEFIYNDKYRVVEILINLLSNALKFTFKGSITLSVMKDHAHPKKIKFSVKDTGLGIKEEDKPKLFQMFGKISQQNKNVNSHGAGLGLTISNSLVKALNNQDEETIELESEYLKGSAFSFRIPFKRSPDNLFLDIPSRDNTPHNDSIHAQEFYDGEDTVYTKMETLTNQGAIYSSMDQSEDLFINRRNRSPGLSTFFFTLLPKTPSRKVLIVDDNPFNLLTACFLLEKKGLNVDKATSGEHCIELLQKSFEEKNYYDLIFMDIQMPIQDGIETTKIIVSKIRSGELYDVPIVALTANKVMTQEMDVYKESGMKEAIEKPLREESLQRILNTYLHMSEMRRTSKQESSTTEKINMFSS